MADRLRCPGCNEYFDQKNMRLVKDVYWCQSCREKRKSNKTSSGSSGITSAEQATTSVGTGQAQRMTKDTAS